MCKIDFKTKISTHKESGTVLYFCKCLQCPANKNNIWILISASVFSTLQCPMLSSLWPTSYAQEKTRAKKANNILVFL